MNRHMNRGALTTMCGVVLVLGLAVAVTVVSGCGSSQGKDGQVEGPTWVLRSFRDSGGDTRAVPAGVRVYAVFAAGQVSGSSGCSDYQGPARISGSRLEIGPLATTKRTCLPSVVEIERTYLANLESSATAAVQDESGSLVIRDTEGDVILTFAVEKPREFSGSSWKLATYNNGTGGAVPVLEDTHIDVTFDEGGDFSGLAGCNSYWGTYTVAGDKLSIDSLGSTELYCAEPAGIMEQEEAYLKALRDATAFTIRGDTLELRSSDGALLCSYDAWKMPPGG